MLVGVACWSLEFFIGFGFRMWVFGIRSDCRIFGVFWLRSINIFFVGVILFYLMWFKFYVFLVRILFC